MLHAQLFDLQPVLAFLPLFVIGLVVHFFIRATRATDMSRSTEAELGQVRPLLLRDEKKAVEDDFHSATVEALRPPSASSSLVDLENENNQPDESSSNYPPPP